MQKLNLSGRIEKTELRVSGVPTSVHIEQSRQLVILNSSGVEQSTNGVVILKVDDRRTAEFDAWCAAISCSLEHLIEIEVLRNAVKAPLRPIDSVPYLGSNDQALEC